MKFKIFILLIFANLSLFNTAKTAKVKEKEEKTEIFVTFDIKDPDLVLPLEHDIKDFTAKINSYYKMPKAKLSKAGYKFVGWSADSIRGYSRDDIFFVEGTENIAFKPIFVDTNDKTKYTVEYYVEIDGRAVNTSEILPPRKYYKNSLVEVDISIIKNDKLSQRGWQFDGNEFIGQQKFVMPAKNIVLIPIWETLYKLTYFAGENEVIAGNYKVEITLKEGEQINLSDSSLFLRKGYKLKCWYCSFDEKEYNFYFNYTMPNDDVNFYAVWEPIKYVIIFEVAIKGVDNIKIEGITGTSITIPDMAYVKKGYKFEGWNYEDKIYKPGDDFYIEGSFPGLGISLFAIWTKKE